MIQYRTQEEEERFVFEAFAKICPLGITHFESRPKPEPDILACLSTNEQVAFEVTQVDDEKHQRLRKAAGELNEKLAAARDGLVDPHKWHGYIIGVRFPDQVKFVTRPTFVPEIIQLLNTSEPGQLYYAIRDRKGQIICSLRATKLDLDTEVYISTSSASGVGDYTLEGVSKKLGKKYQTPHPIHLLAWSEITWLPDAWKGELETLFRQQTKFKRIWVYGYASNEIVFDSDVLK